MVSRLGGILSRAKVPNQPWRLGKRKFLDAQKGKAGLVNGLRSRPALEAVKVLDAQKGTAGFVCSRPVVLWCIGCTGPGPWRDRRGGQPKEGYAVFCKKGYHIRENMLSVKRAGMEALLDPEVGQQLALSSGWLWAPLAGENGVEAPSCYSGRKRVAKRNRKRKRHLKPEGTATGATGCWWSASLGG